MKTTIESDMLFDIFTSVKADEIIACPLDEIETVCGSILSDYENVLVPAMKNLVNQTNRQ